VLSVVLWYHFAFVVVSVAMLGVGLSGMILVLWPSLLKADSRAQMGRWAMAMAAAILAAILAIAWIPFDPFRISEAPIQLLWAALVCVALALPFVFGGLAIGTVLMNDARVGRLYALDLLGAATGAVLAPLLLRPLGGLGTLAALGAIASVAAIVLTRGRLRGLAVLVTLPLLLGAATNERLVQLRITSDKQAKPANVVPIMTRWSALARVDVFKRGVLIDGGTAALGIPESMEEAVRSNYSTLPHALLEHPRTLVLGAGAGREVVEALHHRAVEVTGVEINADIVDLTRPGGLADVGLHDDPRVTFVQDEARSYLARAQREWDLIISVHTISNAAFQSGSLALVENHLLTAEAFDELFDHLAPEGVLYITRPEIQIDRLLWTALDALARRGHPDPAGTVMVIRQHSFLAALLVAPRGLRTLDAERLASSHRVELLAPPGLATGPYVEMLDYLQHPDTVPRAIRPATDDRPYFNLRRPWWDLTFADIVEVLGKGEAGRMALEDAPVGQVSLILVACITVFGAFAATIVPIGSRRRMLLVDRASALAVIVLFSALGAAFMLLDLGLIHVFTLFVGPPTVAVAAVLFGLLLGSSAGAWWSERLSTEFNGPAIATVAAVAAIAVPMLAGLVLAWPLALRVAVCVAVTATIAVPLGLPFSLGLRRCRARAPQLLGLAWGVTGFASVLGGVAALLLSSSLGFRSVLVVAALHYAVAALAWRSWATSAASR
jgi:SAM-dependent methyltransferase